MSIPPEYQFDHLYKSEAWLIRFGRYLTVSKSAKGKDDKRRDTLLYCMWGKAKDVLLTFILSGYSRKYDVMMRCLHELYYYYCLYFAIQITQGEKYNPF